MSDGLSERQLQAITDIERACSVLSLLGCVWIIFTFCCSSSFHKPINRLVFYASFGNMMSNVGTLMSRSYLKSPNSVGCQFQAFLIQMFMPADAYWTLAMAVNVYLTFYRKYDARMLRGMEMTYLLLCYGIPFVPAFTYIFIKSGENKRMYGNATLWCWVTTEWDAWRIATFYGPVMVVIVVIFFIYIRAGRTIYERRKQLNQFQSSDTDPLSTIDVISTIRTTEVTITPGAAALESEEIRTQSAGRLSPVAMLNSRGANAAYSVHISADPRALDDAVSSIPEAIVSKRTTKAVMEAPSRPLNLRRRTYEINNAAWAYTKCSLLFFTAILITWIPSSANRVYSVVHDKEIYPPLEFMSAFVLPLQGFWNALIYTVISWTACKNLISDLEFGSRPDVTELVGGMSPEADAAHSHDCRPSQSKSGPKPTERLDDSDSMTELANSRSPSAGEDPRA